MSRDIWVISDTHYGHENIIRYCNRPFANATEMDETILANWNAVVKPGDIVYHLGDVYFGGGRGAEYWDWFFPRLHGRKRLILGNHDSGKDQRLLRTFGKVEVWRMFPEFGLLLTHVPVHPDSLRRDGWHLKNVHGHIHERSLDDERYQCVCVEHTNYGPVNIEDLRVR